MWNNCTGLYYKEKLLLAAHAVMARTLSIPSVNMVFLTQCDRASMYMHNVIRQRLLPCLRVTDIEFSRCQKGY